MKLKKMRMNLMKGRRKKISKSYLNKIERYKIFDRYD